MFLTAPTDQPSNSEPSAEIHARFTGNFGSLRLFVSFGSELFSFKFLTSHVQRTSASVLKLESLSIESLVYMLFVMCKYHLKFLKIYALYLFDMIACYAYYGFIYLLGLNPKHKTECVNTFVLNEGNYKWLSS